MLAKVLRKTCTGPVCPFSSARGRRTGHEGHKPRDRPGRLPQADVSTASVLMLASCRVSDDKKSVPEKSWREGETQDARSEMTGDGHCGPPPQANMTGVPDSFALFCAAPWSYCLCPLGLYSQGGMCPFVHKDAHKHSPDVERVNWKWPRAGSGSKLRNESRRICEMSPCST